MKVKILNLLVAVISRALAYISLPKLRRLAGGGQLFLVKRPLFCSVLSKTE